MLKRLTQTSCKSSLAETTKGGLPAGRTRSNFFPSIALSATLAGTPAWSSNNLGRTAATPLKRTMLSITVDAVNVAAAFDVEVPFTPINATLVAHLDSSGNVDGSTHNSYLCASACKERSNNKYDCLEQLLLLATDVLHILVEGF